MEQPGFKREHLSPSLNGHSDSIPTTLEDVKMLNAMKPSLSNAAGLQNGHTQLLPTTDSKYAHQTPPTETQSDSEDYETKEETSPEPSFTPSTSAPPQQPTKQKSPSKRPAKAPVQLIPHCPRAEKAAHATFEELDTNWHQYKYLGRTKVQEDAMACECQYKPGDPIDRACGPHSDCINRLTQVECLDGECKCRHYCQNQRFQRRQYADVHIVQTEMKGFGLRAGSPIHRDDFIYEYIGEVVNEQTLHRRMAAYGDEGLEHFYFMMLQKDEFIDATKKGGIGRFANHSCNPNCYVARWVVGGRLRMGIFAKRDIQKDEELTFNYNADRYGHEAQKCYCGEPNCIGYIGGKTQTDLGGMDELYIDALGIADEVESLGLKGSKKKKGKKLDEDFNPVLKPMVESDVPKVVNAIRQTTTRSILTKLIERIRLTDDQAVLRQVTRLRGLSLMTPTLTEYKDDAEVQTLILETIGKWPFVNRTKIEDSKIEPILMELARCENPTLCSLSEKLLASWSTLETVYRIPKKIKRDEEDEDLNIIQAVKDDLDERPAKRVKRDEPALGIKPLGVVRPASVVATTPYRKDSVKTPAAPATPVVSNQPSKGSLSQIIEQAMEDARRAQEEQAAKEAAMAAEEKRLEEERALRRQRAKEKAEKHRRQKEKGKDKSAKPHKSRSSSSFDPQNSVPPKEGGKSVSNREKQLLKLVGSIVVGYLSQWRTTFDSSEEFKRHAKEITHKIADQEKQGRTYKSGARLDALSDEKRAKIKSYVKSYVGKLVRNSPSKDPRRLTSGQALNAAKVPSVNTPTLENEAHGTDEAAGLSDSDSGMDTDDPESDPEDEDVLTSSKHDGNAQDLEQSLMEMDT